MKKRHLVLACVVSALSPAFVEQPVERNPALAGAHELLFERNEGQFDPGVEYVVRANDDVFFFTSDHVVASHDGSVVTLTFGRSVEPRGEVPFATRTNYFVGPEARWRSNVPCFGRVVYPSIHEGVDLVFHGESGKLEYDYVVQPGADVDDLRVETDGELRLSQAGAIETRAGGSTFVQGPPRIFQIEDGREEPIAGAYRLDETRIAFEVGSYDATRALVIDPVIGFSTYFGGTATEYTLSIAADTTGNVLFTGSTQSTDFPTKSASQGTIAGSNDVFVTKLASGGASVVYSTYLGGTAFEEGQHIATDASGNAYVAGDTYSTDFPTKNAYQSSNGGSMDAFLTKLDSNGSLVFSTYFGGNQIEQPLGLAVTSGGNAYIAGLTGSTNLPLKSAFQNTLQGITDVFVTKFDTSGSALVFSTFLGGAQTESASGVAVDSVGDAYVAGQTSSSDFPTKGPFQSSNAGQQDVFVTKITSSGSLGYSTYLGGSLDDSSRGIAVDGSGQAIVAGYTSSTNFPTKNAFQSGKSTYDDAWVTKLDATGSSLVYSTYLGGDGTDWLYGAATDGAGNAYVAGYTSSTNYPTKTAIQASSAGSLDAMITKLDSAGALVWSTYLGGTAMDEAVAIAADDRAVYLVANTSSTDFPLKNALQTTPRYSAILTLVEALAITPQTSNVPPKGSLKLAVTGGAGGNVYSIVTNGSGGTINAATGDYVAGPNGNTTDAVQVADGSSAKATATVNVGPGVTIAPPAPTVAPKGTLTLTATGGSNTGFTWSMTTNASGGTIANGDYTAGAAGNVTDVVAATDSLGNVGSASISVGAGPSLPPLVISPSAPKALPGDTISFTASGGTGAGFGWSLAVNASGATIDPSSGEYHAGPNAGSLLDVVDVVEVTDSANTSATTNVTVGTSSGGCSCNESGDVHGLSGLLLVLYIVRRRRSVISSPASWAS